MVERERLGLVYTKWLLRRKGYTISDLNFTALFYGVTYFVGWFGEACRHKFSSKKANTWTDIKIYYYFVFLYLQTFKF